MTGLYRISPSARDKADFIKRSLDRDGIPYTVEMNGEITVIRASGTPKKRKYTPSKPSILPAPLTLEQCTRNLAEADRIFRWTQENLRDRLRRNWCHDNYYRWKTYPSRDRQQRIGHAVAAVIARFRSTEYGSKGDRNPHRYTKQDYAELDAAVGRKVRRASQLPMRYTNVLEYIVRSEARGDWKQKERNTEPIPQEPRKTAIQEYLEANLDVEYWQEMVRLASDREQMRQDVAA